MDRSILRFTLRSRAVAIASTAFLGAGLLGGVAFAAMPATADQVAMTVPDTQTAIAEADKGRTKLKAVLDGLVAKGVISQAQADSVTAAVGEHKGEQKKDAHQPIKDLIGDVMKAGVAYIGLPADQIKAQLATGKTLGQIADVTAGKSRGGLLAALDTATAARIKTAVDAGTLTAAQGEQARTKAHEAAVRLVDHSMRQKPAAKK